MSRMPRPPRERSGPHVAPPPQSNDIHDDRNVRCGCGFAYNGYLWGSCPKCEADETGLYALVCNSCRTPYHTAEREDLCPECGSLDTSIVVRPEQPAVR